MIRPYTPAELQADRQQTVRKDDPLGRARRQTLALYGVAVDDYVNGSVRFSPAMHQTERAILLGMAGQEDSPERHQVVWADVPQGPSWDTRDSDRRAA